MSARERILRLLSDGLPRSLDEIAKDLKDVSRGRILNLLHILWRDQVILRSEKPLYINGVRRYLYMSAGKPGVVKVNGMRFLPYNPDLIDVRGRRGRVSKLELVRRFLRDHVGQAFFATEVKEILKERGITQSDVMNAARKGRASRNILVFGYRMKDGRETPFQRGFLLTWIPKDMPRDEAVRYAVRVCRKRLMEEGEESGAFMNVRRIRDEVIVATERGSIVSVARLRDKLKLTKTQMDSLLSKIRRLYDDVCTISIMGQSYLYHASLDENLLKAAVKAEEERLARLKSKMYRISHNWEACVEWFVEKLTPNARFWEQKHRTSAMDARRITIRLIKPIRGRRRVAEVDRVWEVDHGPLTPKTIYVLECKWGLIRRRDLEEFFDILRYSKEFGADSPDGRVVKQGVIGVFAGGAFNSSEKVVVNGVELSLAKYAARLNIQLITATKLNGILHEHGVPRKVTVQKICKRAKNESDVRQILDKIWNDPSRAGVMLRNLG